MLLVFCISIIREYLLKKAKIWDEELTPDLLIPLAAYSALRKRFRLIEQYLASSISSPKDIENIHKLRVSIRRTSTALSAFSFLFPKATQQRLRHVLKFLRQWAGELRDLDIVIHSLQETEKTLQSSQSNLLLIIREMLHYFTKQREYQYVSLNELYYHIINNNWHKKWNTSIQNIGFKHQTTEIYLGQLAPRLIKKAWSEFYLQSFENLTNELELHKLRILGKRIRYLIELFAYSLPEEFRTTTYQSFVSLQETLGAINDVRTVIRRLELGLKNFSPEIVNEQTKLIEYFSSVNELNKTIFYDKLNDWKNKGTIQHLNTMIMNLTVSFPAHIPT